MKNIYIHVCRIKNNMFIHVNDCECIKFKVLLMERSQPGEKYIYQNESDSVPMTFKIEAS